ncbi:class I SAM-dependent methyltransferase [Pseudomonas nitroreducens]|uniref:class I SAM-dependent methyltransferase n=1 Tax=Pseudomonas nitroreducens TaxID=46680 RepID=UPI0014762059|nr:class I SAM-dependent methyltransferase [Pseudomonas nitroreducens]MDG9852373.1 class I SAM-dependent methyltransferase [Pseudomonas nitroreducens]NMZ76375.1 class I SAM-dependent methyltransferase [Pseudomonas nitroreducens]NNN23291.1 class I SAM-dependent methyltransferase [Pseudomonas nitroreducens]
MTTQNNYKYNANDDAISLWQKNFTSRIGDGSGDPEEEFLTYVKLVAQLKPTTPWLEIGCGLGRMIELLDTERNAIIGLEPDQDRFSDCKKRYRGKGNIEIFNITSRELRKTQPAARFDLILNSMVLQHVSTGICDEILQDIRELLSPDGVALVSTTQNCKELFTFQSSPKHQTRQEFDDYAANPGQQSFGIPVRKFSKDSFLSALDSNGLAVLHWGQFSYIRPEKVDWFANQYQVSSSDIRDVGDSQYALLRRK